MMELQWPLILFTTLVAWSAGLFGTQALMAVFGVGKKARAEVAGMGLRRLVGRARGRHGAQLHDGRPPRLGLGPLDPLRPRQRLRVGPRDVRPPLRLGCRGTPGPARRARSRRRGPRR